MPLNHGPNHSGIVRNPSQQWNLGLGRDLLYLFGHFGVCSFALFALFEGRAVG
jgi:hypothetical protein